MKKRDDQLLRAIDGETQGVSELYIEYGQKIRVAKRCVQELLGFDLDVLISKKQPHVDGRRIVWAILKTEGISYVQLASIFKCKVWDHASISHALKEHERLADKQYRATFQKVHDMYKQEIIKLTSSEQRLAQVNDEINKLSQIKASIEMDIRISEIITKNN